MKQFTVLHEGQVRIGDAYETRNVPVQTKSSRRRPSQCSFFR